MKKLIIITTALLISLPQISYAKSGAYFGIDALRIHSKHRLRGHSADFNTLYTIPSTRNLVDDENYNIGVNLGYKLDLNRQVYIAPELFFENINNTVNYNYLNSSTRLHQNEIVLNYRYGAKLNLGANLTRNFSTFINYGVAMMDYDVRWALDSDNTGRYHYQDTTPSEIYGFGFLYKLNRNWSAKAAWDRQTTNVTYVYRGLNSRARTQTIKLGLVYNF